MDDFALAEAGCELARGLGCLECPLEQRLHRPPKFGQMGVGSFPVEEQPPELFFKLLDGPREGRLCDVAILCRPREIECPAYGEKISDLVKLHGRTIPSATPRNPAPRMG